MHETARRSGGLYRDTIDARTGEWTSEVATIANDQAVDYFANCVNVAIQSQDSVPLLYFRDAVKVAGSSKLFVTNSTTGHLYVRDLDVQFNQRAHHMDRDAGLLVSCTRCSAA